MATQRFRGMVDVLSSEGEVAAKAYCELVIDALGLGLEEWEGVLREVAPAGALAGSHRYRLRLPNASEAEIVVNRTFARGQGEEASAVYQFLGSGAPPSLVSAGGG